MSSTAPPNPARAQATPLRAPGTPIRVIWTVQVMQDLFDVMLGAWVVPFSQLTGAMQAWSVVLAILLVSLIVVWLYRSERVPAEDAAESQEGNMEFLLLGLLLASLLMVATSRILFRATPARVDRWFRRLQLVSASLYSLGHGGNDAQKTMGIILMLLIAAGITRPEDGVPGWVVVSCYVAIALGTMFGGWRIVKTMGQKITKLKPIGGFAAETGGAMTLFLASSLGIPVATTHTITGAIVGVGAAQRTRAVRWGVAGNIVVAWLITMPAAAAMAAGAYWLGTALLGLDRWWIVTRILLAPLDLGAIFNSGNSSGAY